MAVLLGVFASGCCTEDQPPAVVRTTPSEKPTPAAGSTPVEQMTPSVSDTPWERQTPDIRDTPTERIVSTASEQETCTEDCDEMSYGDNIDYIGRVPDVQVQQRGDNERIVLNIRLYNPRAEEVDRPVQETYEFNQIKLSCVSNGREAEYITDLGGTVRLGSGRAYTRTIASGQVLEDLGIQDDVPLTCWIAFIDNGDEKFAAEAELESQQGSGEVGITRIGETEEMWE